MSFIKKSNTASQLANLSLIIGNNIINDLNLTSDTPDISEKIVLNSTFENYEDDNGKDVYAIEILASADSGNGGGVKIESSLDDDGAILLKATDVAGGITITPGKES